VISEVLSLEHRVGRRVYRQRYPHAPCCYRTPQGTWRAEVSYRGQRYRLGNRRTHDEVAALVATFRRQVAAAEPVTQLQATLIERR